MNDKLMARGRVLLVALAVFVGACGEPAQLPRAEAAITSGRAITLEDVRAIGVPNTAMPFDNVITAGQPTQEQLSALVALGYTHFISLRASTEEGAGWEEAIVPDEGISFARIPVSGAEGLTRANVEELDRLLDEAGAAGTVLYCGTSGRVGAMLALRAYWLDGANPEAALALGREAGMTRLEPAVAELLALPR